MDFNIWGRFWPTKMLFDSIYKFLQFCKALQGSSQTWSAEAFSKLLWKDTSERKRFNATMFAGESPESCVANQVTLLVVPKQTCLALPRLGLEMSFRGISFLGGTGVKSNKLKSRYVDLFNFRTGQRTNEAKPHATPGLTVGPTLPSAVKRRAINLDVGNYHGWPKN